MPQVQPDTSLPPFNYLRAAPSRGRWFPGLFEEGSGPRAASPALLRASPRCPPVGWDAAPAYAPDSVRPPRGGAAASDRRGGSTAAVPGFTDTSSMSPGSNLKEASVFSSSGPSRLGHTCPIGLTKNEPVLWEIQGGHGRLFRDKQYNSSAMRTHRLGYTKANETSQNGWRAGS